MIPLFRKLQLENLLKQNGLLLDLGCGNGKMSEPFFQYGYETILVDKDPKVIVEAGDRFKKIKETGFRVVNAPIERFEFEDSYEGVILSNVLPFQKDKENIERIIQTSFDKLTKGGFLYFTLFGVRDEWVNEYKDKMVFYEKEEALGSIKDEPYFVSEDYGQGLTMKGDIKTWHIFTLLYIK